MSSTGTFCIISYNRETNASLILDDFDTPDLIPLDDFVAKRLG